MQYCKHVAGVTLSDIPPVGCTAMQTGERLSVAPAVKTEVYSFCQKNSLVYVDSHLLKNIRRGV